MRVNSFRVSFQRSRSVTISGWLASKFPANSSLQRVFRGTPLVSCSLNRASVTGAVTQLLSSGEACATLFLLTWFPRGKKKRRRRKKLGFKAELLMSILWIRINEHSDLIIVIVIKKWTHRTCYNLPVWSICLSCISVWSYNIKGGLIQSGDASRSFWLTTFNCHSIKLRSADGRQS